ncbi:MAG: hypothetical protein KKG99_16870 [Bacteroidetes bacterium]|nr:hypothetical protein [Bacteroidota bacterium]
MKNSYNSCKSIFYSILLLAIVSLTFSSCQKEGPMGPEGPAGEDARNSVSSFYYTIYEDEWQTFGEPGIGFGYTGSMDFPEITDDVLNYGAVLVYLYQDNKLFPLPTTFINAGDGGYMTSIWVTLQYEQVLITFQDSDGYTINPGDQEFKVVIIEGGIPIPQSLNLKDYDEVKKYFNLK